MSPHVVALICAGVSAVVALVLALAWAIARLWCMPRRKRAPVDPADLGPAAQPLSIRSHGVALRGWFIPPTPGPGPFATIALAHGWSRSAADMVPAASFLRRAGFAVALFDARGHGESGPDGPITIRKFAEDIQACLTSLGARADVDPGRIGLLGHSMGGSSALLVASEDPRVRAVVSCSAFADPRGITRDLLIKLHIPRWPFLDLVCGFIERWLGTSMEDVTPSRRIGRIAVPLLLLHGERDRFIPPAHMATLYALSRRDRAEARSLPARRHADVTTDVMCGQEILAFFGEHLSSALSTADAR